MRNLPLGCRPPRVGVPDLRRENSRKRSGARSPEDAINAGIGRCIVVILRGGVSWVTTRESLDVVIYPYLASDRVAEQLGGCVAQAALEQGRRHSVRNPGRPVRRRYHLIAERLPANDGWDWTVWRQGDEPETSRHGYAPGAITAMAAAEGAARHWEARAATGSSADT